MEQSLARLLEFSLLPVAKVLTISAIGLLMASRYFNILSPQGRKQLSQLVFKVFLPFYIFTQLGKAVTLEKLLLWWFIPVNVLLAVALGSFLGLLTVLVVKPPPGFLKFTVVMVGVGNTANIPIVLVDAICRDRNNPFGKACGTDGAAFISFGQWLGAVIAYTFVYEMLAPPAISSHEENLSSSLIKTETQAQSWIKASKLDRIIQPPIIASILALLIGSTPFLKKFILGESSVVYFIPASISMLAEAMSPCILLILGGNLIKGPGASKLGWKTTVAICAERLLLLPPIGIAVVTLADRLGFLPPDNKMFRLVLLLHYTTPTAVIAGAVTNLHGYAEEEAAAILFWQHIASVLTMTAWLAVYINLIL